MCIRLHHIFISVRDAVVRVAVDCSLSWRSNVDLDTVHTLTEALLVMSLQFCIAKHLVSLQWIFSLKDHSCCNLKLIFFCREMLEAKTNLVCIKYIRYKKISFGVHRITFEAIFTLP